MAGRPKIFDENDVVRKASEVFWIKGYEAATAEELLAAMNIGKGSFYLHFKGGKKELYQKSLELFSSDSMARFYNGLRITDDEIGYIKNFMLSLLDNSDERKRKGCYIGNGIIEMSHLDLMTRDQAGKHMLKLEEAFTDIISKAQEKDQLKNKTNAKVLAKYLINLRNGINVSLRTDKEIEMMREAVMMGLQILE